MNIPGCSEDDGYTQSAGVSRYRNAQSAVSVQLVFTDM